MIPHSHSLHNMYLMKHSTRKLKHHKNDPYQLIDCVRDVCFCSIDTTSHRIYFPTFTTRANSETEYHLTVEAGSSYKRAANSQGRCVSLSKVREIEENRIEHAELKEDHGLEEESAVDS
jgi:hypothetical protein